MGSEEAAVGGLAKGLPCRSASRSAPRQPPTLLRWGNSSRQFSRIDSYVRERLALFDSKKRGKRGRRWGRVHDPAWFAGLGTFTLSGTVRYLGTATATT